MDIVAPRSTLPWTFFLLVFVLSVPFGLVGALTDLQLLPGLPVSSFMWVCPATAASILVYKQNRTAGVIELLKRSFDYKRIKAKIWLVPTVLLMPGVTVVAYGLMRVAGSPLPAARVAVTATLATFPVVFIAALGEELGWSGYATDRLQQRLSALGAAIFLGLAWAVWHWVPLMQAHRSPEWIAWWSLYTVASRVLIVWLYNNTGKSVFTAAVYHAISNVCWLQFPNYESNWDPRVTGLLVTVVATIATFSWGPQTLARYRYASQATPAE